MSVVTEQFRSTPTARRRIIQTTTDRIRTDGRFFRLGPDKFFIKGVTYGPFAPDSHGQPWPTPAQVSRDFQQLIDLNANCLRVYHTPPTWFLDLAHARQLKIFVDVAWPKNISFENDPAIVTIAENAVRTAAAVCGNHPAVFALSIVNEFPADLLRFIGQQKVEKLINHLVRIGKSQAPHCLVTFANYPTTEYLAPGEIDFHCFNVYLHQDQVFRNYLARLQNRSGTKPLLIGEYGVDTFQEQSEENQAVILTAHIHAVFEEGLGGTFIFSFTDDWFTKGSQISQWQFGLTRADRTPKLAYAAVRSVFAKVPHTFQGDLPSMSVIVCSFNGGCTVESCLSSLARLAYPDYEVIFVDDGSTDQTAQIVEQFPRVRYIRQSNQGLSVARNTGLAAAKNQVIVYTDSDCEADEDWLYYLAVTFKRSGHVGVGGPNLIPDEGNWIAACVGHAPGGPTHVMIDDRIAEHVPGCNMAFYKWAANQVNGFDRQFRKAGDDVDFIWRLQNAGLTIGYSPAAQVWHYRRNTVKAYLNQQRGYGQAEALLKYKHPDRFNTLGASHWRGQIYGVDHVGVRLGRSVIYHGVFGAGLFQTIYHRRASLMVMMMMSVEWHMLMAFVFVLGLAFHPLLWVALIMLITPVSLALVAAVQSPLPKKHHPTARALIALLHYWQPITRGWARHSVRLNHHGLGNCLSDRLQAVALPFDPKDPATLRYWSTDRDRFHLLEQMNHRMRTAGWRTRQDSGWANWDLEIYCSHLVKVRLTTATEIHGSNGLLTRVRVKPAMSKLCLVLLFASLVLSAPLLLHFWPLCICAALIPLAVCLLFYHARHRAKRPVLAMIDDVARKSGYYRVPTK